MANLGFSYVVLYRTSVPRDETVVNQVPPRVTLFRVAILGSASMYSHWRTERGGTGVVGSSIPNNDFETALSLYDEWVEELL